MDFLKRLCLYICIVLLCISVYKDISKGTPSIQHNKKEQQEVIKNENVSIIKIKIKPGDTVLSITEQINNFKNQDQGINIQQILTDFKRYNPNADTDHLQLNEYYYFLYYDDV